MPSDSEGGVFNIMEYVDIVDENCKVLYKVSKQEAHEKGLLHKCVIAEIINSKGEFLLVKQSADRQDPGQFVSPVGGHVKAGESDEDALKREALEEVGLKNINFKYIGRSIFKRPSRGKIENHYFIVYEIYADAELILNEESVAYKPFTKEEIKTIYHNNFEQFGDAYKFLLQTIYKKLI